MFGPQGNLPSTLTHDFSRVPRAEIQRSTFNRDHGLKTTFDSGYLVPIFYDEALPGDTFSLSAHGFGRLATPLHPFMDNLYIETFFFAVPNRLLWDNWQKFMGEQTNPGDSTDYLVPVTSGTVANSTLYDYFGVPTQVATEWNNWCGRAYNLIYNEWFRDENLQNSVTVDKGDGPDTITDYTILKRGKRKDYFTSALPWPQKGDAVALPLGTKAPVAADNTSWITGGSTSTALGILAPQMDSSNHPLVTNATYLYPSAATDALDANMLYADLSDATAATINQLREAFQIQKLYERDARGGTRYTELIHSHFGVTSPDARLQRP
uniref:major capsid protein n=1 Tax=Shewanella sp. TaxID=50422 RepID=UPI004047C21D